jgi:acyl-coenzyme A synthetase/AMP-(fatty) acid ligase
MQMVFTAPMYDAIPTVELLKKLKCSVMLAPAAVPPLTNEILKIYPMKCFQIPSTEDLLTQEYPLYALSKTYETAKDEPLVAFHTAGTTGFPKPVIWTHAWADSFAAERYLESPEGYESMENHISGVRLFSLMPPFHVSSNIAMTVSMAVVVLTTMFPGSPSLCRALLLAVWRHCSYLSTF